MKRRRRVVFALVVAALVLLEAGNILYIRKTSPHHDGVSAAEQVESYTASMMYLVDKYLETAEGDTQQQVTILYDLGTYAGKCGSALASFRTTVERIGNSRRVGLLSSPVYAVPLDHMFQGMYSFVMFLRRCTRAALENEQGDILREYLSEAKEELGKIHDVFTANDFSQCKSSGAFYRKYNEILWDSSITHLFNNFAYYLVEAPPQV